MTEANIPTSGSGPIMVPLPDGAHALLRQPRTVPERLRRPLANARARLSAMLPDPPPGMSESDRTMFFGKAISAHPEDMDRVNDLLILALVSDWSFDMPVTEASLGELSGETYDALKAEAEKYRDALFPSFEPTADPDSPTVPSSDSEG